MGELIDFDKAKTKRKLKEIAAKKGIVYEIYLTVVKYVYKYMDKEHQHSIEFLTTEARLEEIFAGNTSRFAASFSEILQYWDLDSLYPGERQAEGGFETFRTIGDLCTYVEQKINEEKKS